MRKQEKQHPNFFKKYFLNFLTWARPESPSVRAVKKDDDGTRKHFPPPNLFLIPPSPARPACPDSDPIFFLSKKKKKKQVSCIDTVKKPYPVCLCVSVCLLNNNDILIVEERLFEFSSSLVPLAITTSCTFY